MFGLTKVIAKIALAIYSTTGFSPENLIERTKILIYGAKDPVVEHAVKENDFKTLLNREDLKMSVKQRDELTNLLISRVRKSKDRIRLDLMGESDMQKVTLGSLAALLFFYSLIYTLRCKEAKLGITKFKNAQKLLAIFIQSAGIGGGLALIHTGLNQEFSKQEYANNLATLDALKDIKVS